MTLQRTIEQSTLRSSLVLTISPFFVSNSRAFDSINSDTRISSATACKAISQHQRDELRLVTHSIFRCIGLCNSVQQFTEFFVNSPSFGRLQVLHIRQVLNSSILIPLRVILQHRQPNRFFCESRHTRCARKSATSWVRLVISI